MNARQNEKEMTMKNDLLHRAKAALDCEPAPTAMDAANLLAEMYDELCMGASREAELLEMLEKSLGECEIAALQGMRSEVLHYQREFHRMRDHLAAEKSGQEAFALRVLGEERYGNSPCQAHPLELVEQELERVKEELAHVTKQRERK
jgi:hypothetical protein